MGQSLGMYQAQEEYLREGYRAFAREALKAFKKFRFRGRTMYTCNVARLRECNRLGDAKEVALWRTHFFLCSTYFNDVDGAVFNSRPGEELADITRRQEVGPMYLAVSITEIMDTRNGVVWETDVPLVFASAETRNEH